MHPNISQDHNLKGIGGWLILVIISLILTSLISMVYISSDIMYFFEPDNWYAITTYGSEAYHPLFGPLIIYELIINFTLILFPIFLLFLMFKKSRLFPKFMIIYLIGGVILHFIDFSLCYVVFSTVPVLAETFDETMYSLIQGSVQVIVSAAIWVPYFIYSKRVKVTFLSINSGIRQMNSTQENADTEKN
jgi:hypothetical protein